MDKTNNGLFFLGLIILIIAGIVFLLSQPTEQQARYVKTSSGDEDFDYDYYFPEKPSLENLELSETPVPLTLTECEKKQGFDKDYCIARIARNKQDSSLCFNISEESEIGNCLYETALQSNDAQTCKKMEFGATDCLLEIALQSENHEFCEMAGFEKNQCLQAVSEQNFDLCIGLGLNRQYCNDAVDQKNKTHCDKIIDASQNCFFELAKKTLNAQFCQKTGIIKNTCIYTIAINTLNPLTCNLLEQRKDNCIAQIALNSNNKTLCEQAGTQKQTCIEDIKALYE